MQPLKVNTKTLKTQKNRLITKVGDDETVKLNSIDIVDNSVVNFNTIADSIINMRDPIRNINSSGNLISTGIVNKTGLGSLYLWGDNSEYGGVFNINEGDFYALFDEADEYDQRHEFSLERAIITFADNTTFRPMVTNDNKIADLGTNATVGDNVKLLPYNLSSLDKGLHLYDVDYSAFEDWSNDLAAVDTSTEDTKIVIKKNLAGYQDLGALADIYRLRTDLSSEERMLFDNIYYTGEVSNEVKEQFNIIGGADKIVYTEVHKAGVRQFNRQIYSRIQNKNCSSCGMLDGYADEHLWFNIGQNNIEKKTKGNDLGYDYKPTNLAIGYDHDFIPNALNLGVAFSYAYGEVEGKGQSIHNSSDIDEYMLSFYGKYKPVRAYVTGNLGGGLIQNKTKTQSSTISTRGEYDTYTAFATVEFGYDFGNACGVIEPFTGLEYAYIYTESYNEKGLGARHLASDSFNAIEAPIGLRVSRNMVLDSFILTPAIELAYARSLGDTSSKVESYFVGSPESPWVMKGTAAGRDSIRSSLNLKINNIYTPIALNFGYARDTKSDYSDDQFYLTIRYNF
ncbi:MAG: autotransporter outer membrane beta-barrel domain-containing protein [Alphaproteobacteria bacterium]|nr:autotransporter outer membrane beta-barrel domain-containing protein [Alphaproteobacteria bacterium]